MSAIHRGQGLTIKGKSSLEYLLTSHLFLLTSAYNVITDLIPNLEYLLAWNLGNLKSLPLERVSASENLFLPDHNYEHCLDIVIKKYNFLLVF